jgi:ubiquinone/menaquinone biosynthesis C-methylase UbiE
MHTESWAAPPEQASLLQAAEAYDLRFRSARGLRRLYRWLEMRAVERALARTGGESVLDCPCGTGRLDGLLRARFRRVTGLDRSEAMLTVYRRGDPARAGEVGDAFHLPFEDASFDWVVSHRLFHHLRTDERRLELLRSFARVARRGVVLYAFVETPIRRGRFGFKTIALDHARRLLGEAGLELRAACFAAWPLQPKVELVARKR